MFEDEPPRRATTIEEAGEVFDAVTHHAGGYSSFRYASLHEAPPAGQRVLERQLELADRWRP